MDIEYKSSGIRRNVPNAIAKTLIARGLARKVKNPVAPETADISPVTGKPKRKYQRRDMQAEAPANEAASGYEHADMQAD